MSGPNFFSTTKKGEVFELKADLASSEQPKKLMAVKKVIAAMTIGKDVSSLFVEMLKCIQTSDIELKKLIYLYLMNYAKTQPEKVILAVSTFLRDSQDPNPLVRALAIRTMACIRVNEIVEYIVDPLRRCLADAEPYVRKTAAIAVAKLYDLSAELTESAGFVQELVRLLSDPNSMVVSNAVAALSEISQLADRQMLVTTHETLNNLLAALSECSEWGQIFVLDALAAYMPKGSREAEHVCERILPRLQHANPAVVLSTVKLVLLYVPTISNQEFAKMCLKKLAPPLVSLLASEPEIQYVALRCIVLVVQMHPALLRGNVQPFFLKYGDPHYVKTEKLDVLLHLASAKNAEVLLAELREYCVDMDVKVIGKAVQLIGLVGAKVAAAAEPAVRTLVGLMRAAREHESHATQPVIQQAVASLVDLFRRYPKTFDAAVVEICESLAYVGDADGLAATVWVIGEFAARVANASELLADWIDEWATLKEPVRAQLLTATVKAFLVAPTNTQALVQTVLRKATEDPRSPDVRDRAYVYWRLLSTRPEAARQVVLADRPVIRIVDMQLPEAAVALLMRHVSSLAAVYHKPPSMFVPAGRGRPHESAEDDEQGPGGAGDGDAADGDGDAAATGAAADGFGLTASGTPIAAAASAGTRASGAGGLLDLGSLMTGPAPGASGSPAPTASLLDLVSGPSPAAAAAAAAAAAPSPSGVNALASLFAAGGASALPLLGGGADAGLTSLATPAETWLTGATGKGLQLAGTWQRVGGSPALVLTLTNLTMAPLREFALQFNTNAFGLVPSPAVTLAALVPSLAPNASVTVTQPLATNGPVGMVAEDPTVVQMGLKTNIDTLYFQVCVPIYVLFVEGGELDRVAFLSAWRALPAESEAHATFPPSRLSPQALADALRTRANVFLLALRDAPEIGGAIGMFTARVHNGLEFLLELKIAPTEIAVALRTSSVIVAPQVLATIGVAIATVSK